MKLNSLRHAIRRSTGPITATVDLGNGMPLTVALKKASLLDALTVAFDGQADAETGYDFNAATGLLHLVEDGGPVDDEDDDIIL